MLTIYAMHASCLATGARLDEAESLARSEVRNGQVRLVRTKNGKGRSGDRKSRSAPIQKEVEEAALSVAMPGSGRLFMPCRGAFRSAYQRCGFHTPGQLTHILRHTFASHYMMGGGDILSLQRILGHSSIPMTMRYGLSRSWWTGS